MRQEESPKIQGTHCDTRQPRLAPNLVNAFQAQTHPTGFIGLMLIFSESSAEYKQGGPSLWPAQNFPVEQHRLVFIKAKDSARSLHPVHFLIFGNQHSGNRRHGGFGIGPVMTGLVKPLNSVIQQCIP